MTETRQKWYEKPQTITISPLELNLLLHEELKKVNYDFSNPIKRDMLLVDLVIAILKQSPPE